MSGMSFKKANREASRKAKQQRKQEKRQQKQTAAADKPEQSKENSNAEL
jgi:hypothetical protein